MSFEMPNIEQIQREQAANCLSSWYPRLAARVPTPDTEIVKTEIELIELVDGKEPEGFELFLMELQAAISKVGGYPVFLRSGLYSSKHNWNKTCFVEDPDRLRHHVHDLVEYSEIVDMFGLPHNVWAVRRLIETEAAFYAFPGRMPVTKERRYFFKDGVLVCHHPYWPPECITQPDVEDWQEKLAELNEESEHEVGYLTTYTERVARAFEGAWSVDWLCDKDGKWWAIDMALAQTSFHWEGCPCAAELA